MDDFFKTGVGKALLRFESALGTAWVADQNESSSDRRLKAVWDAANTAREELVKTIKTAIESGRAI